MIALIPPANSLIINYWQGNKMKDSSCVEGYKNYIKGKYFGILRDCEKKKDYSNLLDSLMVDLIGAAEEYDSIQLVNLYQKTASLKYLNYKYFRETIMDCMHLVDVVFN